MLIERGFSKEVAGTDWDVVLAGVMMMLSDTMARGLLIVGPPGVGKTHLMHALYRFPNRLPKMWVDCSDREDVILKMDPFTTYYKMFALQKYESNFYLDDLGADPVMSEYGNRVDHVAEFIDSYYRNGHGRLIISTNLHSNRTEEHPSDGLLERYGARILDRLRHMTIVLPMKGKSKRAKEIVK